MSVTKSWQLTYEDLQGFPEDGRRHELIDGEHLVTPAPGRRHQKVGARLLARLQAFVEERGLGEVYGAPFDVVLSEHDVVQPDLLFVAGARLSSLTEAGLRGAPDLVVEILSERTRRRDEVEKRKLYERHGALEYWIVDPELERVKVHRRAGEGFAPAVEVSAEAGESLASPLLPGFSVAVAELFA